MKKCYRCEEVKPYTEFNKNSHHKDGYHSICRPCMKEYKDDHYQTNKETIKEKNRQRKQSLLEWFKEYKSTLKCIQCGENHPATLDFHHRNPEEKDFTVCKMVCDGFSRQNIIDEISKCDVLCANCHRKLHYNAGIV